MAHFPILKTGAVAQHPVLTAKRFRTEVLSFLDGSEQRYPQQERALLSWTLTYTDLDEGEMQTLRNFVTEQATTNTPFTFTDPGTGVTYPSCRLTDWLLEEHWQAEEAGGAVITIQEVLE